MFTDSSADLPTDDELLDRLLQQARWPDPDPAQLARLQRCWQRLRPRRRQPRWWWASAAAVLLIVAGTLLSMSLDRKPQPPPHRPGQLAGGPVRKPIKSAAREPTQQPLDASHPRTAARPAASRPPTIYERIVMTARVQALPSASPDDPAAERRLLQEVLDKLQVQMTQAGAFVSGTSAPADSALPAAAHRSPASETDALRAAKAVAAESRRVAELAEPLAPRRDRHERALWTKIQSAGGSAQPAEARLLAHLATAQSLPLLMHLAQRPAVRSACLPAIGRLADPRDTARMAAAQTDEFARQQLLWGLLERGTPDALLAVLDCIRDHSIDVSALAAVQQSANPPLEPLFEILDGPDVSLRLAAARALGRRSEPAVARRLAQQVLTNASRQEALVGLLSSADPAASDFLDRARQSTYLVAAVHAAQWQLHSLVQNPPRYP